MNKFLLERLYYKSTYTIGKLYWIEYEMDGGNHKPQTSTNGHCLNAVRGKVNLKSQSYLCDTLEPPSAHLKQNDDPQKILAAKAQGYRAIPSGMYKMAITYSPRFNKRLPLLLNVPCFEGIRIHPGNYPKDTQGCILPGWNRKKGMVCDSRKAMEEIMSIMKKHEDIDFEII